MQETTAIDDLCFSGQFVADTFRLSSKFTGFCGQSEDAYFEKALKTKDESFFSCENHFARARSYDPQTGRFVQKDPIGFASGETNLYRYVENSPVNFVDPNGLFIIVINDPGARGGATYGGTITVIPDNGPMVVVPGSSYPNPSNANPGVSAGTYSGTYSPIGLHPSRPDGGRPAVTINGGRDIPTMGPNPNNGFQNNGNQIKIHCGDSLSNRGSQGCMTIQPGSCNKALGSLVPGESGSVIIGR